MQHQAYLTFSLYLFFISCRYFYASRPRRHVSDLSVRLCVRTCDRAEPFSGRLAADF